MYVGERKTLFKTLFQQCVHHPFNIIATSHKQAALLWFISLKWMMLLYIACCFISMTCFCCWCCCFVIVAKTSPPFCNSFSWMLVAYIILLALSWCHNGRDSVSNHQPRDCLLNRLFRRRSKKASKLCVTGLCVGNSPGTVEFPHKWPVTRKKFPFDYVIMGFTAVCSWGVS